MKPVKEVEMAQIKVEKLTVGHEGKAVVENLNFEVNKGDYVCILGENGSGKSTLTKTLVGLLSPLEGSIQFEDDISRKQIGYLPQQTEVQKDFPASVWEVVLSGCQSQKKFGFFYSREDRERAKSNITRMGIEELVDRSFRELSGGQQQRALLARALCATQKILILDEPVSGLDPEVTENMYQILKALNKEGITIIMVSHDINSAMKYSTHILHVGKNTYFCTKSEYMNSNRVMFMKKERRGACSN